MWLIPSLPDSRSAQVSGCSTRECEQDSNTLDTDIKFWVMRNGTHTQSPRSWRGWTRRLWSQRLFGAMISQKWTPSLCGDESEFCQPVFLASRGPSPESKAASPTSDGFGTTSLESSTECNPSGCSWKTCQDSPAAILNGEHWQTEQRSLFDGTAWMPFYERWPKEGSMRNGRMYRRKKLARRTDASACSSWPSPHTPSPHSSDNSETTYTGRAAAIWPSPRSEDSESCGNHPDATDSLTGATGLWPTPNNFSAGNGPDGNEFSTQARAWATPNAHDGRRPTDEHSTQGANLQREADQWATPNGSAAGSKSRGGDRIDEPLLGGQVQQWPTPASRDYRSPNSQDSQDSQDSRGRNTTTGQQLQNFVEHVPTTATCLPPDQTASGGEKSRHTSTRRLNPAFVCWLQGWPWHWTRAEPINCGAAETALFRSRLLSHLSNLPVASSNPDPQRPTKG